MAVVISAALMAEKSARKTCWPAKRAIHFTVLSITWMPISTMLSACHTSAQAFGDALCGVGGKTMQQEVTGSRRQLALFRNWRMGAPQSRCFLPRDHSPATRLGGCSPWPLAGGVCRHGPSADRTKSKGS